MSSEETKNSGASTSTSSETTKIQTKLKTRATSYDWQMLLQTFAILGASLTFVLFMCLGYFKMTKIMDSFIPLQQEYVEQVKIVAKNTAAPTASSTVQHKGKPYVIVVPQKDGVSEEEWFAQLEAKLHYAEGP